MKALLCAACGDVRAFPSSGEFVSCECGNIEARWADARAGTAVFRARDRSKAFVLGLNNVMLHAAFAGGLRTNALRREVHKVATEAPNHIFDESRAACWAVVFRVGDTSDVTWADDEEVVPPRGDDAIGL